MSKYGPKAQLSATTHQWGDFYTKTASDVIAGTWKTTNVWGGMKDGMIKLAPLNPAIPGRRQGRWSRSSKARSRPARCIRSPVPCQGPGRQGRASPPARTMTDDELGKMDYYVEGVASKLPKK